MRHLILAIFFTLLSQASLADWKLDNNLSTLNFLSTKKGTVTETHSFTRLDGFVSSEGKAEISIDLASVETHIAIRNERMQKLLFNIAKYTTATASLSLNPEQLKALNAGERIVMEPAAVINLHGLSKTVPVKLAVTALEGDKIQVHPLTPLLINAADFGLTAGIEALRTVAKLSSINTVVPTTFTLIFQKQ